MSNLTERHGDLILPQGTYALVQDGASGQVDVVVGPHKVSLADTDKPVIYDHNTHRYVRIPGTGDAVLVNPSATEGQYIVLFNPSVENHGKKHPSKGKQQSMDLSIGQKINIPGPYTMPLFPGQHAMVLDGHQIKSNEYLLCRVYNEDMAKANLKDAVIKTTGNADEVVGKNDLVIGKLFIIKGTDVSFYIPPTGIEVVRSGSEYVRNAVTLERLEYCILLDQNGDKRFVQGPVVVFPNPTESFVEQNGTNKFKAIELNENMGIYVKVINDYDDGHDKYKSGDELFITGKDQKIYYPRPEHAIVKYGDQMVHYATAVPSGEARYVLNKQTGEVEMVMGPKMLLPDPRNSVMVRRVLDDRTVALWFPNNQDALEYNRSLKTVYQQDSPTMDSMASMRLSSFKESVRFGAMSDEMQRSNTYSKPRTITLDTKFEGAVRINVWPGYAIQVVKKNGDRELVEGPKVRLLAYDEELEVLSLSTGKPKSDATLQRTTYLQKENNVVSDIIDGETSDSVQVFVRLSYRVNFDPGQKEKWFSVSNYVKLLTQHLRSVVRNRVKKTSIEDFSQNCTDIIRDLVLGEPNENGRRPGRQFSENGMSVYDIEVLGLSIGNPEVEQMLKDAQQATVSHRLKLQRKRQSFEFDSESAKLDQAEMELEKQTKSKRLELKKLAITSDMEVEQLELEKRVKLESDEKTHEKAMQELINYIAEQQRSRFLQDHEAKISLETKESEVRTKEHTARMNAIQPRLIEALLRMSDAQFVDTLAKNLQHQNNGLGTVFKGGFEGILDLVKGSPLEHKIARLTENDGNKNQ